jgi:hypothetical protein
MDAPFPNFSEFSIDKGGAVRLYDPEAFTLCTRRR